MIGYNMFKEVIDEYDERRIELQERIAKTNQELAEASSALNTNISRSLNSQIEILHDNQKKIDAQCKIIRTESDKLVTQSQNWMKMYSNLNNSLKKVGDLNNWALVLEKDLAEVSSAITKLVTK